MKTPSFIFAVTRGSCNSGEVLVTMSFPFCVSQLVLANVMNNCKTHAGGMMHRQVKSKPLNRSPRVQDYIRHIAISLRLSDFLRSQLEEPQVCR